MRGNSDFFGEQRIDSIDERTLSVELRMKCAELSASTTATIELSSERLSLRTGACNLGNSCGLDIDFNSERENFAKTPSSPAENKVLDSVRAKHGAHLCQCTE